MPNFTQTAVSMSARRIFTAPITNAETYDAVIASLLADETMGLTKKEKTGETYTAKIEYFDAAGEVNNTASVTAFSRADFNTMKTKMLESATAEAFAGTDAEAAELTSKSTWNVRVSCAIGTDTFSVSLNRDDMTVTGYALPATLAALETWADSVEALC